MKPVQATYSIPHAAVGEILAVDQRGKFRTVRQRSLCTARPAVSHESANLRTLPNANDPASHPHQTSGRKCAGWRPFEGLKKAEAASRGDRCAAHGLRLSPASRLAICLQEFSPASPASLFSERREPCVPHNKAIMSHNRANLPWTNAPPLWPSWDSRSIRGRGQGKGLWQRSRDASARSGALVGPRRAKIPPGTKCAAPRCRSRTCWAAIRAETALLAENCPIPAP